MRHHVLFLVLAALLACATPARAARHDWRFWQWFRHHGGVTVGVDPTVTWAPPTTDCNGSALTQAVAGYNVYAVSGTTIPTVTSPATDIPCGAVPTVDRTKATPLNGTTPIAPSACTGTPTVCTYAATLPSGTYTVGVEAVAADGSVSGVSNTLTVNVVDRPHAPASITVGK